MTKRKAERRELLKDDLALTFLERLARSIQEQPVKYLAGTLAVFGTVALIFGSSAFMKSQKIKKAQVLYQAEKILETEVGDADAEQSFETEEEKLDAALAKLDQIIAAESGAVRQQALVRKVKVLINLGRNSEVESLYKEIIDNDQGFAFMGVLGLADMYFAEGRFEDAKEQYNRLISGMKSVPDLNDWVAFRIAACYKEEGDLEQARTSLNALVGKYKGVSQQDLPPIVPKAQALLDEIEKETGNVPEEAAS